MLLRALILFFFAFGTLANCSSDFYKKLQDGASIIPIEVKEETDTQDRDDWNFFLNFSCNKMCLNEIIFRDCFVI